MGRLASSSSSSLTGQHGAPFRPAACVRAAASLREPDAVVMAPPQASLVPHHVPRTVVRRTRSRAKTSSERGILFRRRQKQYEDELEAQVQQLREQVAELHFMSTLWRDQAVLERSNPSGSLVRRTREFYTVLRNGLETLDPVDGNLEETLAIVQRKEAYMRAVLDPDVAFGNLCGVNTAIDQWRKHTMAYSKFDIELGRANVMFDSENEDETIVMICTTANVRFSRESLRMMFPFLFAYRREDLVQRMIDRDFKMDCVTRFHYSSEGRIVMYNIDLNYIGVFLQLLGNVRDVSELMELSLISSDAMTLANEGPDIPPDANLSDIGDADISLEALE